MGERVMRFGSDRVGQLLTVDRGLELRHLRVRRVRLGRGQRCQGARTDMQPRQSRDGQLQQCQPLSAVMTMVRSSASMTRSVPYWLPVSGLANTICQMDASGGRNASRTCAASVTKPPATIARTVVFMSLRRANSAVNAINAMSGIVRENQHGHACGDECGMWITGTGEQQQTRWRTPPACRTPSIRIRRNPGRTVARRTRSAPST